MSIRWINHVWLNSPYGGERLLVHLALADFANDEGLCWPSIATLAKKSRCGERLVQRQIADMIIDGWLVLDSRGGGRGRSNCYLLQTPSAKRGLPGSETPSPATESLGETTYRTVKNLPAVDADFDAFWSAYPRKVAKQHARRVFVSLMRRRDHPSVADLVAAVTAYSTTFSDIRYCAHPATWLRQERWTDHDTATAPATRVEVEQRIRDAESFGAGYAHAGHNETQLLTDLANRPDDERDAAVAIHRELTRGRRR